MRHGNGSAGASNGIGAGASITGEYNQIAERSRGGRGKAHHDVGGTKPRQAKGCARQDCKRLATCAGHAVTQGRSAHVCDGETGPRAGACSHEPKVHTWRSHCQPRWDQARASDRVSAVAGVAGEDDVCAVSVGCGRTKSHDHRAGLSSSQGEWAAADQTESGSARDGYRASQAKAAEVYGLECQGVRAANNHSTKTLAGWSGQEPGRSVGHADVIVSLSAA